MHMYKVGDGMFGMRRGKALSFALKHTINIHIVPDRPTY